MNDSQSSEIQSALDKALGKGRTGQVSEAIQDLTALTERAPDFVSGWGHKGYLLILTGRPDEALSCYRRILELEPENEEAKFRMAECYQVLGDLRSAHRIYDSLTGAGSIAPGELEARKAASEPLLTRILRRIPMVALQGLRKCGDPTFSKGILGEIASLGRSAPGIRNAGLSAYLTYLNRQYLQSDWYRYPKEPCDLCGNTRFRATYFLDCQKSVRCEACGLETVERKPPDSMDVLYGHYELDSTIEFFEEMWNDPIQFEARVRRIQGLFTESGVPFPIQGGRAFEFGCGQGHLLNRLREGGMEVEGLETSVRLVGDCKRLFEIEARYGTVARYEAPLSQFDLVLGFHMLEHLDHPSMLFEKARQMLKPNGYLLLEVPIPDLEKCSPIQKLDRIYGYGNLGHLYYFTKETLPKYFEKFGFERTGTYSYAEEGLGSGGFLGRRV
jgi:SAM-dependent methyltransferase